jgi:hypothetical protein
MQLMMQMVQSLAVGASTTQQASLFGTSSRENISAATLASVVGHRPSLSTQCIQHFQPVQQQQPRLPYQCVQQQNLHQQPFPLNMPAHNPSSFIIPMQQFQQNFQKEWTELNQRQQQLKIANPPQYPVVRQEPNQPQHMLDTEKPPQPRQKPGNGHEHARMMK